MPKPLLRIIALLLVTCLLADPVTASAFSTNNFSPAAYSINSQESCLKTQALTEPVVFFLRRPMILRASLVVLGLVGSIAGFWASKHVSWTWIEVSVFAVCAAIIGRLGRAPELFLSPDGVGP